MTQASNIVGLNAAFTSGALTATGAVTTHDTTVTIVYANNGRLYTKTAITTGTTPTTDGNTGAAFVPVGINKGCQFVWALLPTDGSVKVYQGPLRNVDDDSAWKLGGPSIYPAVPDSVTPFAIMEVVHDESGSNWTFGTSNWNATGVTATIEDICTMPLRPIDL